MNKEYKKNLEMTENKLISKYYEENEIPYHYIWYYIDEKSKKKVPIGEYNKALKKTVDQKLKKQKMEGMRMTQEQENKIKKLNENEKSSLTICYTSFLKHTNNIYCIDIDEEKIKSTEDLPEEFGKIKMSGYVKGNTKGIHIYIKILNMIEYENQQDIIKSLKGDLIRENNIWERDDKRYNYNEGNEKIMEIEWNDIKYLFDEKKMNKKNKEDENTVILTRDILMSCENTVNLCNDNSSVISDMTENTIMNNENKNIIELEYFKKLVYNLNVKRSNDYDNWKLVVWGISNVSRDNKWSLEIRNEIIHEFSKKSEKYDKSKVDFFIDNNIKDIKDGINVGSIVEWYRIDNNIIKENKNIVNTINEISTINIISTINEISLNYILNNRLRDYDIAKYIKNKLGTNYVCSDIKNNLWYYFENPLWCEDLEGVKISNKISEDIPKEAEFNIKNLNNEITNILTNDDLQEDEKTDAVNKRKTNIKKLNVFIDKCKNNSSKKSIINELKKLCYRDKFVSNLDKNPYLLGCKNGIIDFKNNIFRDGKPEDMCSMSVGYDFISLNDIINNKILIEKYNELKHFMESLFVIEGIRNYMYEHLASLLIGICKEQDFNYYMGKGSNGKTKLVKLMSMVMGDYYGTAPTSLLCSKKVDLGGCSSEIALLKGKRYVVMQEPTKGETINEGVMKELTGENDLFCNPKHRTPFYFTPMFKLVICANFTLDIKSNDHGTWRRIKVVDFLSQFKNNADKNEIFEFEKNIDLEEKFNDWKYILLAILTEKAYILKGRINENEYIKNATNKYREEQDKIGLYIKNNIDFIDDEKIDKDELGENFKNWIDLNFRIRIGVNHLLERLENEYYLTYDNLTIYGIKIKYISNDIIKSDECLFLEEFKKCFEIIINNEDKDKYFIKSVRLSEWAKLKNLKIFTSKTINKILLEKLNYDTKSNLEKKSIENNKVWIYKNIKEL